MRPAARALPALAVLALVTSACSGGDGDADPSSSTSPSTSSSAAPGTAAPAAVRSFEPAVPLCDELPDPADSLDWSGIQRSDTPQPTVTRDALLLALDFPYVVDYWGGTGDREGWIVIGVSGGAVELQSVIDLYHPRARVLVMPLGWTPLELHSLADEVDAAAAGLGIDPAVVSISRGVVRVPLGTITEERVAPLTAFADRRVCLDGDLA